MARQTEERDVYRIPENFVDTGTVMGGMFKLRKRPRKFLCKSMNKYFQSDKTQSKSKT